MADEDSNCIDDFEIRRTIGISYGEFDLYLMNESNAYRNPRPGSKVETIHERETTRINVPEEFLRDMVPYLSSYFGTKSSIVWNSAVKYGLEKIQHQIDEMGLSKNIKIYDMLRRFKPLFIQEVPMILPTGIIYKSATVKLSDSVKSELFNLCKNIGADEKSVCLSAINISFLDSDILKSNFYTVQEGQTLSTESELYNNLKLKNILLLNLFSVTGHKVYTEIYNNIVRNCKSGDGMEIEKLRWALNQLRMRNSLKEKVPDNPLKHEVDSYKKELQRVIKECINKSKSINKDSDIISVNNLKSTHRIIKQVCKDNPVFTGKIRNQVIELNKKIAGLNKK